MRVQDICQFNTRSCRPHQNLGEVVQILWENDCSFVPVVDHENRPIGLLTERDVAIAVGTRGCAARDICAGDVTQGRVVSCRPQDDVRTALQTLSQNKCRQILVCDEEGQFEGTLCLDNILNALLDPSGKTDGSLTLKDVTTVLASLACPTASCGSKQEAPKARKELVAGRK